MPLNRSTRLNNTVEVRIDFGEGADLNVRVRKVARSWANIKELMRVSRDVTIKSRQSLDLKKQMENGADAETKAKLQAQIEDLDADSNKSVESLVDWMCGHDGKPGAIADWDYFEDEAQTQKVAITRERIEEFEPAEIALVSGGILESLSVPEAKSVNSAAQ